MSGNGGAHDLEPLEPRSVVRVCGQEYSSEKLCIMRAKPYHERYGEAHATLSGLGCVGGRDQRRAKRSAYDSSVPASRGCDSLVRVRERQLSEGAIKLLTVAR